MNVGDWRNVCRATLGLAALLGLSALTGCGSAPVNPNLIPVTGTVTLDGQPLVAASVTFVGVNETPGQGGTGLTDETGKFELAHYRAGVGAEAGAYKVVVSKVVQSDGSPLPAGTLSIAELSTRDLVPYRFSDYYGTTLKADVQPGAGPIDFRLTSR